ALALLAWDPGNLHDPSFQLSFAACVGLLALNKGLRELLPLPAPGPESPRWRRWLETPLGALTTTAAATLATLPLTALHFQRASLASIPANVVAVPVGLATTAVCAVAVGVGLVSRAAMAPILWVAAPLASLLDRLAEWFASLPGATIPMAPPTAAETIAMWAGALCFALLRRAPRRAFAGLLAATLALWSPWSGAADDRLLVDFLAVGQGDATLLRLPDGSRMLIDAGGDLRGERDMARRVLLPQLAALGVSRLDVLALSHLHPDHVGSVPTLLDTLPVAELWTSGRPLEGRFGAPIAERIEALEIPRRILSRGAAPIELGGVRIEILGPPDRDGLRDEPLFGANDGSLVLRIIHGDVAILLPGDVEEEGEAALVESGAPLAAALLKAPHHGSSTSSTAAFLEKVAPGHVVFCVGRRNQFGFPREDVVERYEKIGCRLHRTDRGPVRFASDGKTIVPIDD
ncbi:MAG TPA: ComEC/Rec2 family competence protein, partial [Vulgatibacter sp.]